MRKRLLEVAALILMLCVVAFTPRLADAQVSSTLATVGLSYSVGQSITVVATPSTTTFTGSTPTSGNISVTTTWQLASGVETNLDTNMGFATAAAALTDGSGDNIPVANVYQNKDGGGFSACNHNQAADVTGLTNGATCNNGQHVAITTNLAGSMTNTFALQLQGLPALPAGTYTGTLVIIAGAL